MINWISLAIGGLAGTFARYFLSGAVPRIAGFPLGTLAVNLTGCFLAGLLMAVADQKFNLGFSARLLLITGFCGAFTTFSAFVIETDQLLCQGSFLKAALNILVSVIAGLLLYRLGVWLGGRIS